MMCSFINRNYNYGRGPAITTYYLYKRLTLKPAVHIYSEMRTIKLFIRTIVCIITLHVTIFVYGVAPARADYPLIEDLRATITTLTKARNSIVLKHQNSGMPDIQETTEQQDLLIFVSYLDGRIYYYCEQLLVIGGIDALNETACPVNQYGTLETTQYTTIPSTPSKTTEEKLTELDSSFSESLGSFDDMLLTEQQKVASHAPKQREAGSGTGTDQYDGVNSSGSQGQDGGSGTANNTNSGQAGSSAERSGSRNQSATSPGAGSNSGTGVGSTKQSQTPPTSGNKDLSQTDDDIIAKQLKEAAEQETDPQVKAKLWEEYRKYKEGIR